MIRVRFSQFLQLTELEVLHFHYFLFPGKIKAVLDLPIKPFTKSTFKVRKSMRENADQRKVEQLYPRRC